MSEETQRPCDGWGEVSSHAAEKVRLVWTVSGARLYLCDDCNAARQNDFGAMMGRVSKKFDQGSLSDEEAQR